MAWLGLVVAVATAAAVEAGSNSCTMSKLAAVAIAFVVVNAVVSKASAKASDYLGSEVENTRQMRKHEAWKTEFWDKHKNPRASSEKQPLS